MTKTCAIIGCSPICFPWGFDEEDEGCAALKLIAVYDPDDPRCERETAAVVVAEMLNTQVVTVDPNAIHFF